MTQHARSPRQIFRPRARVALATPVLLAIAGLTGWQALHVPSASAEDVAKPARLITVEQRSEGLERRFFGRVAALATVDLSFQVNGQVVTFPVEEGETVPAGELVAQLDLEPFELSLERADLEAQQAERALGRITQLTGTTVSEAAREDADTAFQLARVRLRNAEYDLEHATLHAPFDALVSARLVENFTTVAVGAPVIRLHNMSELRIEIDVPEVLFQQAAGGAFDVFAQFPSSEELYPLELREVIAEATAIGQSFTVSMSLDPPEDLTILPGSTATVIVREQTSNTRMQMPISAVGIAPDGSTYALLFEPANGSDSGTVRAVPITVEPDEAGFVIVTNGLSDGDEVVGAGVAQLSDGQAIRRFNGFGG